MAVLSYHHILLGNTSYITAAKQFGARGLPLAPNSVHYSHMGLFKSTYLSGTFFSSW